VGWLGQEEVIQDKNISWTSKNIISADEMGAGRLKEIRANEFSLVVETKEWNLHG
jgi:hypothetical protein